jgi:hypothetical protein
MKIFSPVLKGTTVSDGTSNLSGSFTGSLFGTATTASNANTASYVVSSQTDTTQNTRLQTLESVTGSFALTSSFSAYTASNDALNTTQNARLLSNEQKTGSLATTGSNYFIGNQVITGSVYIANDLIVQGSSSLQNITASAVSVGTNTIILNTATPILQFGGISVFDSGSTQGRSGSLLWNSINDHWINVNPSGSDEGYNSAMVINGPKNTGSLGNEAGLTTGYIPRSQGEDHIEDSNIFSTGSNIGINTSTVAEGTQAASSLSIFPSSSVSGGPLIQFASNGRIRPASTGDRLSIDGNALFLNGTFSSTVAIATGGGNVGVGTSSPARKLVVAADDINSGDSGQFHIVGATNPNNKLMLGYDTTSEYAYIKATKSGTATRNLVLQPDGSNVGIGITSPIYALDVYSNQSIFTSRFYQPSSSTSAYNAVMWSGAHTSLVGYITTGGSAVSNTFLQSNMGVGTQNAYGLMFVTNDTGRMYINSSGSVGIGTTTPLTSLGKTLTVIGTGIFQNSAGGGSYNENLRLNRSSGNNYASIALGGAYDSTSGTGAGQWTLVSTPSGVSYAFDFDYNGATVIKFSTAGAATFNSSVTAGNGTAAVNLAINRGAAGDGGGLRFQTAGTNNWYVGTAATGTSTNLDFYNHSTATTNLSLNYSTGYVGIGTTSPSSRLGVRANGAEGLVMEQDEGDANNSGRIFFKNSAQTYGIFNNASDLRITYGAIPGNTSGTSLARFTNTGKYFRMESGTGGIQFQGNTGAANALNYYEQGSWTPSLQNATVSYSDRSGTYVRIGDYVFVRWGFRISSISGQSGTVTISGLPFTSVNWGSYQEPNISVSTGNLATADNAFRARVFVGGSNTSLFGRISNNGDTTWNTSELQNGSWILGEIFYNVP